MSVLHSAAASPRIVRRHWSSSKVAAAATMNGSTQPRRRSLKSVSFVWIRRWKYGMAALILVMMLTLEKRVYDITVSSSSTSSNNENKNSNGQDNNGVSTASHPASCAINLFGLPRAFRKLVLPSLIHHVIPYNDCDYYVHYYYQTEETAGRSGQGGAIDPNDIRLLASAVQTYAPHGKDRRVEFTMTTEEEFWTQYETLIEKIRTTKTSNNKYLYFPWKARTYQHPTTTDNIIKMWHSIQSVWNLMEERTAERSYSTVAMLRSDVVYLTKIELEPSANKDHGGTATPSNMVTIPGFGRHPVSDRAIYGAYDAVKIWATQRLPRLDQHVQWVQQNDPGWGMHSERFMNWTIFPDMRDRLQEDPHWCFLRARADESVWIRDCEISAAPSIAKYVGDVRTAVETAIGRPCPGNITQLTRRFRSLACAEDAAVAS